MALVLADRVQETTTTTGTGSVTLLGAVTGYQSFAVIGNGNTTFYTIADQGGSNWEVGVGTYSTTGPTLARTTVLASSNSGSLVNFTSGTKTVFVTYPSEKSVNLDSSGNVSALGIIASGTWQGSTVQTAYGGTGVTTSTGANSNVLRDANANVSANNFLAGYSSVTAAAGTTVLTAASSYVQRLNGSTTQTFQLPDATTLVNGTAFIFDNDSSGLMTIVDNASGAVDTVPSGGIDFIYLISNATSAGSWTKYAFLPASYDFSGSTASFGSATITNAVWNGTPIASGYGGTGLTTFTAANYALYSTSSSALTAGTLPVPAGGTGQTSFSSGYIPYGNTTAALQSSSLLQFNGSYLQVGGGSALGGTTNPITAFTQSANNYVQTYTYNANSGTSGSADFVSYTDNSTDTHGWADMGFTSSTYADSGYTVTGPNEAYLFGSAPSGAGKTGNLVYATDSTGSANAHQWYVGGFAQAKTAWKMQLTSTGLQLANALAASYGGTGLTSPGTSGNVLTSNGTGWVSSPVSATPAGSNTQVQYNNSGAFGASSSFTYASSTLTAPYVAASGGFHLNALTISTSYSIPSGNSASSVGPLTLSAGVAITVPSGSRWVIL
jgi:hypothetical protein